MTSQSTPQSLMFYTFHVNFGLESSNFATNSKTIAIPI